MNASCLAVHDRVAQTMRDSISTPRAHFAHPIQYTYGTYEMRPITYEYRAVIGSPTVRAFLGRASAYVTPSFLRGTKSRYTPYRMGTPGCPASSACLAIDMARVHLAARPSILGSLVM
jgi:hypothetical protein